MSVLQALPELDEEARELALDLERLAWREKQRPLDFARWLPWQQVAWSLLDGRGWRSEWGPAPSRPPSLICIVSANRTGKTTLGGGAIGGHVTGRLGRWQHPGEVWGGMPTLSDSVAIQRPSVEQWLGPGDGATWVPRRASIPCESLLRTAKGWTARFRAYEQGGKAGDASGGHWESGKCQMVVLDEPPPDHVLAAARSRLIDEDGLLLAVFTPLKGIESPLYRECYEPWQSYRRKHPDAKWGEVAPGVWVFSVGMRDNAVSVGGFLPDDRIEAEEAALIRAGRHLEARVRYHGEWLDISEDRIIPVEQLREWSEEPRQGWKRTMAYIDPAYTARTASCETGIAIASLGHDGLIYLRESLGGRWEPHERLKRCTDLLVEYGCPTTHVQRVGGDIEFANALNSELMRRGHRACVTPWPEKGHVPDKVERANTFAPMVSSGQVMCRPEHVEFKRQAAVFSASYLKAGGRCDVLDAAMGACTDVAEPAGHAAAVLAMTKALQPRDRDEPRPDWSWRGDIEREVD